MVRADATAADRDRLRARLLSPAVRSRCAAASQRALRKAEPLMLQTSSLLADSLADRLVSTFVRSYGKAAPPPYAEILGEASRLVIERLSLSDALYHTAEHTALVTLVAQDIMRGLRF